MTNGFVYMLLHYVFECWMNFGALNFVFGRIDSILRSIFIPVLLTFVYDSK
jgi:hypothetical protein